MFGLLHKFIDSCRTNMNNANPKNMTAEKAFSFAVIKKVGTFDEVLDTFIWKTLDAMYNEISQYDHPVLEAVIEYPTYFNAKWRRLFCERMKSLGYYILFSDSTVCIVSWRYRGDMDVKNEYQPKKNKSHKKKVKKIEKVLLND